jgi:hypothetical protein
MVSPGGSCSILAMRGPRVTKVVVSVVAAEGFSGGADGDGSAVSFGPSEGRFDEVPRLTWSEPRRLLADLRMSRSFKTRWQKLVTQVSEAGMPF